jgi:hypothetical protein
MNLTAVLFASHLSSGPRPYLILSYRIMYYLILSYYYYYNTNNDSNNSDNITSNSGVPAHWSVGPPPSSALPPSGAAPEGLGFRVPGSGCRVKG